MTKGIILKGIGGFYYVDTPDGLIECKARGKFRKTVGKPVVGDRVSLELQPDGTGYLQEIAPRKNCLIRPAVANLDLLVAVASAAPPVTDPFLIDKVTAIAAHKGIDVLVVVNKSDVDPGDELFAIYQKSGIPTLRVSALTGEGIGELRAMLAGKIAAFAGNSGVGKSSVLNRLDGRFAAQVGEISDRIGRGKHTTRHVELMKTPGGGYIADTPGFSSFETEQMDLVLAGDLADAFPEFAPYLDACKFTGCAHVKEKGCAVLAAVERGEIAKSRHESYVKLYESVKDIKEWELSKGGTR
ncbi:ribosome small subunit-dependent GTPase A [Agathobaculum sp.]|uniref:ribosome small subunit-dependent GTPase A n=1 Tax=Agathobaculum sp. TaxID=2048138 RepID=UPI002A823285|nr:ribosome small subunit-dependent GTPase A [Agathobaculum sp.]MDY3618103.1 ribosome small subunit-dependent GTPase A [Agathobaculum sp.]